MPSFSAAIKIKTNATPNAAMSAALPELTCRLVHAGDRSIRFPCGPLDRVLKVLRTSC